MPRTKPKPEPRTRPVPTTPAENGPPGEVLTLKEAAAYLRLPEEEVLRLVRDQALPARQAGAEWRFLKPAIQAWLSQPVPKSTKVFWDYAAVLKGETEEEFEAYRREIQRYRDYIEKGDK